jgi:hypothetical protein
VEAFVAMIFEAGRHEDLGSEVWNEDTVRGTIRRIAEDALTHFDPCTGWPTHPLDEPDSPTQRHAMLYFGAGGVIWALEHLRQAGAIEFDHDFTDTVVALPDRNRSVTNAWGYGTGSYLMGDAGLLLLQWSFTRNSAVADRLFAVVESNIDHPSQEALWGSPGSVVAALHMSETSGETRWSELFVRSMETLFGQMVYDNTLGGWIWVQDLYGERRQFLGAGHGFVGNVYPAVRGAARLPPTLREAFIERALQTLQATAAREDNLINWPPAYDPEGSLPPKWLVQDCHGAPGVVCRTADLPASEAWDRLLLPAGELTWRAGPVAKGPGLCHGTAGNGYALLKLFRRTGHTLWLDRARAFAMHAISQVERERARQGAGRFSLWTGDVGVALYAWNCISGTADFPTLDVF